MGDLRGRAPLFGAIVDIGFHLGLALAIIIQIPGRLSGGLPVTNAYLA